MESKVCSRCGVDKPRSEYYEDNGRWPAQCKSCQRERSREYYARAPGRRRQVARDSQRRARLREYGITQERYDELVAMQDGKCVICDRAGDLQVDHCHTTGEVRFLLCGKCNRGLGLFDDDIERLEAAIRYLQASRVL